MSRLSRINTIWRKELRDTLRDRRTLAAMVLMPMVLYPALMLGSLHAFEYQTHRLKQETYTIGVESDAVREWLQQVVDTDLARRAPEAGIPAEDLAAVAEQTPEANERHPTDPALAERTAPGDDHRRAREGAYERPPEFRVVLVSDVRAALDAGGVHVGVLMNGPVPTDNDKLSTPVLILCDETDFRGQLAQAGLTGIFVRKSMRIAEMRLHRLGLTTDYVQPLPLIQENVAPPVKQGAAVISQIVPLILIIMTITGAIYPAIDLTAGERERNTLETLMVAPVPTSDLIAGKFIVVASIGMLSAFLNLASIGGTIFLSGMGDALVQGNRLTIPLHVLPWVFVSLLPLAILFSAALLAVCSFARSFKEAQNYIMPVMMAALIPAVVGMLPGTRLEGPLLIMPVTNIVLLTRDLFLGAVNYAHILWVFASTSLYAGAAVTVAARLFGQEAVLFNDNSSIQTLFMRRFFKPSNHPTAAQALLVVALVYSLNFFVQQGLGRAYGDAITLFFGALAAVMLILFVAFPLAATIYMRVRVATTFSLEFPPLAGWLAALCFGLSTWILAIAWAPIQSSFLPNSFAEDPQVQQLQQSMLAMPGWWLLFVAAIIPGVCEEFFFRGYALSGLRSAFGRWGAVLAVAAAFAIFHQSIFRLALTFGLGVMLGWLVVRFGSIFPAMLAHVMHNALLTSSLHADLLQPWLTTHGFPVETAEFPPLTWLTPALGLFSVGLLLTIWGPRRRRSEPQVDRRDAEYVAPDTPVYAPRPARPTPEA